MASSAFPSRALTAALFTLLAWAHNPFTTQAQLPDYLPTEGLVGWWPFNGNANDESGNGNDGTVNGATLTEDRDGNADAAFGFDGVDDFIQVLDSPLFNFQLNNSISASFWIRQVSNSSSHLDIVLAKQIGAGLSQNGWNSGVETNGVCSLRIMNGQGSVPLTLGGTPSLNTWTILTFVYDQGWYQTFVNGELQQSGIADPIAVVGSSTSNLFIGKPSWVANNVKSFNGDIDDIAIYNRALTPEEITALYTGQPIVAPCADPTACNFEQEGDCVYPEPNLDCAGNCLNDCNNNGICDEDEVYGCKYPTACNYNPEATSDDDSCTFPAPNYDCDGNCLLDLNNNGLCDLEEETGCTFTEAANYTPGATLDDGSCFVTCKGDVNNDGQITSADLLNFLSSYGSYCSGAGCMDPAGCNYNPNATFDLGYCAYPAEFLDCNGACLNDADGDGVCDELEFLGCTDAAACNYSEEATEENGSCVYPQDYFNCDGSPVNDTDGDGVPDELEVPGCTDANACNYNPAATDNDGSCQIAAEFFDCDGMPLTDTDGDGIPDELEVTGCTNPEACNYDALATDDNGNCELPAEFFNCDGSPINDSDGDGIPDELEVAGCTYPEATNYNSEATDEDGSCIFGIIGPNHTCGAENVHNPDLVYGSVTDIDGNTYRTIVIGEQEWMAENLMVEHYANGDPIPNVTDNAQWAGTTASAWCSYNNSANECPNGKLYKWYVTVDSRNVCPTGWHVPTDQEWFTLMFFLGGEALAGGKLKSMNYFYAPNWGATNETGFSGLPNGMRDIYGTFQDLGYAGYYWSSTENGSSGTTKAWARALEKDHSYLTRIWWPKTVGLSIRCLID